MNKNQKYLNVKEVSNLLGCTARNVQLKIRSGKLEPINPYHKSGYLLPKAYIENIVGKSIKPI